MASNVYRVPIGSGALDKSGEKIRTISAAQGLRLEA
jgi:hypothetical protein